MSPGDFLKRIASAMRLRTLPLSLLSVLVGISATPGEISWARAGLCVLATATLYLAGILVTDLYDHRAGTDKLARLDRSAIPTGSLQLEAGKLTPRQVFATAVSLIAISALSVAGLGNSTLWWYWSAGVLLLTQHAGPPLRIGYVGSGLGELSWLAVFGPLPCAATTLAMQGKVDPTAVWCSVAVGALVAMGFSSHHLLHWRSDRAATKQTPAVSFGEEGALAFIAIVDLAAYIFLVAAGLGGLIPPSSIIGVAGAFVIAIAWRRAVADPLPQRTLQLIGAHLGAAVIAAAACSFALVELARR